MAVFLMSMLALPPLAHATEAVGKALKITFGARGDASTVDRVIVENLSKRERAELAGTDTLLLAVDAQSGIEGITQPHVPDVDVQISNATLTVTTTAAEALVTVHSVSGAIVGQSRTAVCGGRATLALPQLARGIYIVSVQAGSQRRSVKWLCTGSAAAFDAGGSHGTAFVAVAPIRDLARVEAIGAARLVGLRYEAGDVLRFTAKSGTMTTIMNLSPQSSTPVYFDFFRCEDADGNTYAIVRAGDMMWMAEDLKATRVSGAKVVKSLGDWGSDGSDVSAKIYTGGDGVYYSREAAVRAMPEGWSLPSLGEIDYIVKKTTGYYQSAGKALKSRGPEWATQPDGVDEYSVALTPHGYVGNGVLLRQTDAVLLTRSTKNLKPTSFDVTDGSDELTMTNGYDIHNLGFHVRGVRSAPSAYTTMLNRFGMVPSAAYASGEADYGPLGKLFTMLDGRQSLAFDYSGGQLNDSGMEKRSGILTLRNLKKYGLMDEDFSANGFVEQDNKNTLRKMAAMTVNGRQYIIEARWKCPFQLWTRIDKNGKVVRTDNHDEFGLAYVSNGYWDEVVEIAIYGDSATNHRIIKKHLVTGMSFDAAAFYNNFPYFLYGGRTTEARYDFATRYFQLLTADFNRDGTDDIVLGVGGYMTVLDGIKVLNTTRTYTEWNRGKDGEVIAFDNFNRWDRGNDAKTVVRMAVGDVNNDNSPELVLLRARNNPYIKKLELIAVDINKNRGELVLYDDVFGIKHHMYCSLGDKNGTSGNIWFLDVKVGNVTKGKYPDVVMLYREYSGKSYAQSATLAVCQYNPDGTSYDQMFKRIAVDGGTVSGGFRSNAGCAGNCNVTLLRSENGLSSNRDIVAGADLWRWDASAGKVKFDRRVFDWIDKGNYSIFADNIVPVNLMGNGYPEAMYYFASMSTSDNKGQRYMYTFLGANILQWYSTGSNDKNLINWSDWRYNSQLFKYNTHGKQWSSNKECELMWWFGDGDVEWGNNAAMCAVNINASCKTLEYRSTQKAFGEPTIYAMIAAPPTYLYADGEKAPSEDYVTTWGYSRSSSTETTKSGSVSASIIGGFEYEFNLPLVGQKVGGVDFTTKLQSEISKSSSSGTSVTYSQTYEARDDNRVVMQVTPYTLYTYEITNAKDSDEIGGKYQVAIPGKSRTIGLALSDYEALVGNAPGVPYLGNVFKHTIGNPFSYPKPGTIDGWNVMWGNGKDDSYVTTGSGGATTREISIERSTSGSTGFSFSNETELLVTAGCVKAGVGFGYNRSNEVSHSETEGFAVSASVPGLVVGDNNPSRTFFDWNLCWYEYRVGRQTFPVVNYVVKPMSFE